MPFISKINGVDFSASYAATSSYVNLGTDSTIGPQFLGLDENNSYYPTLRGYRLYISGGTSTTITGNSVYVGVDGGNTQLIGTVSLPIATYDITASQALTASLATTASLASTASFLTAGTYQITSSRAINALTSSYFRGPGSATISDDGSNNLSIVANRVFITGSNSVAIRGNNGIDLNGNTTVYGNLLPGGPYANNTSSYNLGSSTSAWKDLYVSNGSVYFISGSNTASISFTNGNIDFGGTNVTIPSGSTIPTASFALSASSADTSSYSTTLGASLLQVAAGNLQLRSSNSTTISTINNFAATTAVTATSASHASTSSFAQNVYAPSFITYSGGSQANSTLTLADVHSSAGWDNIDPGFYEFELYMAYNAALTTTGAKFSISGSVAFNYLGVDVGYTAAVGDRGAFMFRTFDGGGTANSSQFATGNAAIIQGHINTTSTGQLRLRFASEINTSAITVTDVTGYLRRLY
jgi:hypothetical protein